VLATVVIGGACGVRGAVTGALLVAGSDRIAIPVLGAWTARVAQGRGWAWLALLDARSLNFLAFGLVLYAALRLRERSAPTTPH
jgi:ABC-type branched-subunit amino acid transport system permease subunit